MKIDRPGGSKPPTSETAGADGAKEPAASFGDELGGAGGPGEPGGPGGLDPIARIAAELQAGRITPEQAVDRVIQAATDASVPAEVPDSLRAQIREQLERVASDDPFLAARARRLGAAGGHED